MLEKVFLGNSVRNWVVSLCLGLLVWAVFRLLKGLAEIRLNKTAHRTVTPYDDAVLGVLKRTRAFFLVGMAVFVASLVLVLPEGVRKLVDRAAVVLVFVQVLRWGAFAINFFLDLYMQRLDKDDGARATSVRAFAVLIRIAFFATMLLWALDNFGVNITTLIAGLGVGGVAIALATQNILSDLFASLTIVLDKPFVIGDAIQVENLSGTIEQIGLKTTRVRATSGEQLIFPNGNLLQSRIRNFKRMNERRIVHKWRLSYETPVDKLEAFPKIVEKIVRGQARTRFEYITLQSLTDTGAEYELVYWIESAEYRLHIETQQRILFAVLRELEILEVNLASAVLPQLVSPAKS